MESNPQTSFIPKRPLNGSNRPKRETNVFSVIAGVIFVATVLLCIGAFGYKFYLQKSVDTAKTDLENVLSKFEPALITQLSRLDTRLESSKLLVNQHVAVSRFFEFLGSTTIQSVRYSNLTYSQKERSSTIALMGSSRSFAAVALQSAEYAKEANKRYLQSAVFSNFNLDQLGNVGFSVAGTVNPGSFLYRSTLQPSAVEATTTNAQ